MTPTTGWRRALLAGGVLVLTSPMLAHACAASPRSAAPPPFVHQVLPDATLAGQGELRFFGWPVYDARLWVGADFDARLFGQRPLALELTYHRSFTAAAIAQRSLQEIQRQTRLAPEQAQRWQQRLADWLPDVQPGAQLTGLYRPGHGMRLWCGDQALGALEDAELARHFVGIWLSPQTSEPALRRSLLLRAPGGAS